MVRRGKTLTRMKGHTPSQSSTCCIHKQEDLRLLVSLVVGESLLIWSVRVRLVVSLVVSEPSGEQPIIGQSGCGQGKNSGLAPLAHTLEPPPPFQILGTDLYKLFLRDPFRYISVPSPFSSHFLITPSPHPPPPSPHLLPHHPTPSPPTPITPPTSITPPLLSCTTTFHSHCYCDQHRTGKHRCSHH